MTKLSVFYDHIVQASGQSQKTIPEILGFCREQGISAVEIRYTQFAEQEAAIADMLSNAGLCISSMNEFFDFGRDKDLSLAKKMLDTANAHHVSRVLMVPGTLDPADAAELAACSHAYDTTAAFMDAHPQIAHMRQALTDLTAYAAPLGVTITLEDFDGFFQPFARIYPLLWFMKHVPGLRYTLDTGNFAFSDEDIVLAADVLKDYIVHVHCKDRAVNPLVQGMFCHGLGQSPAGSGYIPLAHLLSTLKERGYDGYLAIEHFDVPDQLSFIRQSADFLKKHQ